VPAVASVHATTASPVRLFAAGVGYWLWASSRPEHDGPHGPPLTVSQVNDLAVGAFKVEGGRERDVARASWRGRCGKRTRDPLPLRSGVCKPRTRHRRRARPARRLVLHAQPQLRPTARVDARPRHPPDHDDRRKLFLRRHQRARGGGTVRATGSVRSRRCRRHSGLSRSEGPASAPSE